MRWTIVFCLFCTAFSAQDPGTESLTVLPDRTTLRFGEPFTLVVARTWEASAPMEPLIPAMLDPIDIRPVSSRRTVDGDWVTDVQTYRGRIFQTGRVVLPSVVLRVKESATGIMREVASDPWTFDVTSALDGHDPFVPETPPRDAIRRLATPSSRVAWIVLVGAALIGVFVWRAWRVGRNDEAPERRAAPSLSMRLERLLAASFESASHGRSYVVDEVVACLRDETARRTGMAVESLTDAELESVVGRREGLGPEELAELLDLLRRGSSWRYGRGAPRREDIQRFVLAARDWVDASLAHDAREGVVS